MKELNKLIEGIILGTLVVENKVSIPLCAEKIAHALNNLSAAPVQSNNLQPSAPPFKNGEEEYQKHLRDRTDEYCAGWFDCKKAYNLQPKEGEWPVSGEAQIGVWTTEAQKEAAKGRALIDDITPEAQMRRENK